MSHPKDRRERFLIAKHLGEKRAFNFWGGYNRSSWQSFSPKELEQFKNRAAYKRRDTTKSCSCSMCGNPRRVAWKRKDKLTMQEKKFYEAQEIV